MPQPKAGETVLRTPGQIDGQQFIVENRPGAANLVGTQAVARAAPDGYTFLFATSAALVTNPYTFRKLPYDPVRDFVPVAMAAKSTERSPDTMPGMPCRLLTPHVSCNPMVFWRAGWIFVYPMTLRMPLAAPVAMAMAGD